MTTTRPRIARLCIIATRIRHPSARLLLLTLPLALEAHAYLASEWKEKNRNAQHASKNPYRKNETETEKTRSLAPYQSLTFSFFDLLFLDLSSSPQQPPTMARRRNALAAAAVALLAVAAAGSPSAAAPEPTKNPAPSCTAVYSTQLVKTEFAPGAADAPTARPVPSSFVARGHVMIQTANGSPLDSDARVTIDFGHGVELASQAEVAGDDKAAASTASASAPLFVPAESTSPSVKSFAVVPPSSAARDSSFETASEGGAGAPDAVALTYELSSPSTDFAPRGVSVDGAPCAVASAGAAVPPSPPSDPRSLRSPIPGLSFLEEKPVSTRGDLFIGVDGLPFTIKGINWFGYENGQTNPDGLWGNVSDSIVADFVNVVWRMQLLGFNTIRLPFSFR